MHKNGQKRTPKNGLFFRSPGSSPGRDFKNTEMCFKTLRSLMIRWLQRRRINFFYSSTIRPISPLVSIVHSPANSGPHGNCPAQTAPWSWPRVKHCPRVLHKFSWSHTLNIKTLLLHNEVNPTNE